MSADLARPVNIRYSARSELAAAPMATRVLVALDRVAARSASAARSRTRPSSATP
jgi:hypothetical protein